jgi:hypothetical protein
MPDDIAPSLQSAAVLVWAMTETPPAASALDPVYVQTPPHPNPVPFWRLSDAIEHASETLLNGRHYGKAPWIKAGDSILGPTEIASLYQSILAARRRD